jgi:hypothetical protein
LIGIAAWQTAGVSREEVTPILRTVDAIVAA